MTDIQQKLRQYLTMNMYSSIRNMCIDMNNQREEAADHIAAQEKRIAELEAQIVASADAIDAERYRWLVYAGWFDEEIMRAHGINEGIGDTVDAAIDAAMKAAK